MSDPAQNMGADFLQRAVSMALGEYSVLAPRLASMYEPIDSTLTEGGLIERAADAIPESLQASDAPPQRTETGPTHPLRNSPRTGVTNRVRPTEWADDLIAPAPPKSHAAQRADVEIKSSSRKQTDAAPHQDGPRDFAPKNPRPDSPQPLARPLVAPRLSLPQLELKRAPAAVNVSGKDESAGRRDALHVPEKPGQLIAQPLQTPPMSEPFKHETRPAEAVIHVSIGRVEIRATPAPGPSPAPRSAPKLMGLDEYLNKRGARE